VRNDAAKDGQKSKGQRVVGGPLPFRPWLGLPCRRISSVLHSPCPHHARHVQVQRAHGDGGAVRWRAKTCDCPAPESRFVRTRPRTTCGLHASGQLGPARMQVALPRTRTVPTVDAVERRRWQVGLGAHCALPLCPFGQRNLPRPNQRCLSSRITF
jgi:hypothetical protein